MGRRIFMKFEWGAWSGFLAQEGQMTATFKCGNKFSGCIKRGDFLDYLKTSQLFKTDFAPWSG
jgi:hypothetical protein